MKNVKTVIFLVYLITFQVFCQVPESDVGNANEFVDEILESLRDEESVSEKIDPLKLPDFNGDDFSVTGGIIKGLSSLYRYGDCTVTYDDDVATVSGELAVKNIGLFTHYKAKALFFWIYGRIFGKVDSLAIRMTITAKKGKAKLQSFKVIHLGDYHITKITGVSFMLNWLLKIIVNTIAKQSRGKIISALENEAANGLNDLLSTVPVPF